MTYLQNDRREESECVFLVRKFQNMGGVTNDILSLSEAKQAFSESGAGPYKKIFKYLESLKRRGN